MDRQKIMNEAEKDKIYIDRMCDTHDENELSYLYRIMTGEIANLFLLNIERIRSEQNFYLVTLGD